VRLVVRRVDVIAGVSMELMIAGIVGRGLQGEVVVPR